MTTATTESLISKINKLLALAMNEGATEHERAVAQERADKLMIQNQIDRMDLTVEEKGKIVEETWEFPGLSIKWSNHVRQLADTVIRHCRCRAVMNVGYSGTFKAKVVGFPEDINYVQNLWPIIFMEVSANMFPKWDDSLSLDQNVYRHVKAGYKWREIHEIAFRHGAEGIPNPYPADKSYMNQKYQEEIWSYSYEQRLKMFSYVAEGGLLGRAYKRELKRIGEAYAPSSSRKLAYKTSYFQSFNSTISRRLREMRKKATDTIDDADKLRLAVIDTEEQVLKEFYRLHPEYDPDVQRKQSAEWQVQENLRRSKMTSEQRRAEERRKNREYDRYLKQRDNQHDRAGWQHGNAVAEGVDLNNNTKVKNEKKELS